MHENATCHQSSDYIINFDFKYNYTFMGYKCQNILQMFENRAITRIIIDFHVKRFIRKKGRLRILRTGNTLVLHLSSSP